MVGFGISISLARGLIVAALGAVAFGASSASGAETRVALVIGEGQYQAVPALPNPPNDATDVAEALRSLGFQTTLKLDLGLDGMKKAIADFAAASENADVSLFYYGGHGVQLSQHNYLIPVDAKLHSADDIRKATVPFDDLLDALSKSKGQHLIFLDACRNNPIKDPNAPVTGKGLAEAGKRAGFLTVFATQPDNVALDGAGRNSPFADALLKHMATPGTDISSMIIEVRSDVIGATGGQQVPFENSSLTKQFFFAGDAQAGATPETLMWRLAAAQRDPSLLQIYLDKYPNGAHAGDARSLLSDAGPAPTPVKPVSSVEDDLWSLALASRSPDLAELYAARYPKGAHAAEAQHLLDTLKASEAASNDPTIQCARLATDPKDANALTPGVEIEALAQHADAAIAACQAAADAHPETPHYTALLARATWAAGHYDESLALYRKAADLGDGRAMFSLAYRLAEGLHVAKDAKAAVALYRRAAEAGVADAQVNLAADIFEGKGATKDTAEAFRWMKRAADQGSPAGTLNLGKLVEAGLGDKTLDPLELYRRAASFGESAGYREAARLLEARKDYVGAAGEWMRCVAANDQDCIGALLGPKQVVSAPVVKEMQAKLNAGGYYAGPLDGKSGPPLKDALKQLELLGPPRGV